ncbi:MAG TPA: sugar ABC transporter substrate-binding protein [Bauldia sp.]
MKLNTKMTLAMIALIGGMGFALADDSQSQIPTTGERADGAPQTVKRDWGTFKLADRIAAKLKAGEPINYVFSYQASGIPLFSPQFAAGFQTGCKMGQAILSGMTCASIAPVQTDANQQVSQIEAKLAAGEIDCMGIEPVSSDSTTAIVNKLMDQGIPVFTSGVTSRGHEFTNFTQIPMLEGQTAAKIVLDWMKANNKNLKVFAVSGGDPTQFWAQGRMKGFHEGIMAAIPDAKFVTTEENGLNVSYDPGQTYDAYRTFLSANPDVQFIENVDIGAEHANRAIDSLNKAGQVYTIGWNVSKGQLDGIEKGTQVAALDQRWPDQAAFGGAACAQFLKNGTILPNTQTLKPIMKDQVADQRKELDRILGQ